MTSRMGVARNHEVSSSFSSWGGSCVRSAYPAAGKDPPRGETGSWGKFLTPGGTSVLLAVKFQIKHFLVPPKMRFSKSFLKKE